ncbi:endo-1,4-beta-xylanase [Paenibacillus sp. NEAU-GSW1]|uniref:endo-1,4-beta-xylanase n=1 Tax=Paenibacillus sp. NEAU-GSW1 TaxID=2682486 RepID=UPI0012E1562D|nr:endo-1,4-beta-xylanase [Paenibacillus sp. NEAU-GSW1]MUT67493.1 1,4-beta-xylanase [Paenibacillus sp. NEAU-GSW1]
MNNSLQKSNLVIPGLGQQYKGLFDIGAAVSQTTIETQKELLAAHFNSITAENDMKFERIHPLKDVYTFEAADRLVDFAAKHGMRMRGHTLVWHNQTPDWVFEESDGVPAIRETLLARMKEHIDIVAGRYKGLIYCWDVVNEVIEDKSDVWLRESNWLNGIGEDFIAKAFQFAHEADPNALLFYNDYNECNPEKRDKIIRLIQMLQQQEVPIHGIGLQGHWNLNGPSIAEIREAIEKYAALGLQLQVTELDISMFDFEDRRTDLLQPTAEMLEKQAERYEQVFGLFREYHEVITAITFWGAGDDYTWLDDFPVRGRKNWPFVFDEKHQPKPAFWKIANWNNR